MQPEALRDFEEHAQGCYPSECCGLLVVRRGRELYVPCRNIAEEEDSFLLHPEDWARAEDRGDILAICHSHPDADANPTQSDLQGVERSKLPWYVLGWPSGHLTKTLPSGWSAPLIGRQFYHGTLDCYSLCRDYYAQEHGIVLPDYPREDKWWERGENLYVDHFREAGFVEIDEQQLKPGDAILMNVFSPVPNHAAVYLGEGVILQHLQGRLSGREVYGGYYRKVATHFLRHERLC